MTRNDMHGPYPSAPVHILDGIWRYTTDRTPPGSFVRAVLENDLSEAMGRADDMSLLGLFDIVRYVRWEIPSICHGSPERVQAWLDYDEATRADANDFYGEGGVNDAEEDRVAAEIEAEERRADDNPMVQEVLNAAEEGGS